MVRKIASIDRMYSPTWMGLFGCLKALSTSMNIGRFVKSYRPVQSLSTQFKALESTIGSILFLELYGKACVTCKR